MKSAGTALREFFTERAFLSCWRRRPHCFQRLMAALVGGLAGYLGRRMVQVLRWR